MVLHDKPNVTICYKKAIILSFYTFYIHKREQERRKEDIMPEGLSGKFDFSSLKNTLKQEGVKTSQMNSALNRIAFENNVDNIEELDKSQEIQISQSIFESYAIGQAASALQPNKDELLMPYLANSSAIVENDDTNNLPEIYNDDDYEVVDYDDFYSFSSENDKKEAKSDSNKIDFGTFKDKYANSFATQTPLNSDFALQQLFQKADINSDELLDKNELMSALYNPVFNQQKYTEGADNIQTEGQDPFSLGMMDMDMSNDSFNPQG